MMNANDYKHCSKCDNVFPKETGFYSNKARYDGLSVFCRSCASKLDDKGKLKNIRRRIINILGAKCIECGYDKDIRALQIDHIRGDGASERKEHKGRTYSYILENLDSGKYQILCANCNAIKKIDNNEYPDTLKPYAEPITGELREIVLKAKAPADGRFLPGHVAEIAKLNKDQALEIIERIAKGERQSDLAREYKVTQTCIGHIKFGRAYSDIDRNQYLFKRSSKFRAKALTNTEVIEIRKKLEDGIAGNILSREYGVSQATISKIKLRQAWTHV